MAEPGERAFDDPPSGKQLKSNLILELANDLQGPSTPARQPFHQLSGVPAIRPDQRNRGEQSGRFEEQQLGPVTILNRRRMHHHRQQQPQRIYQEMTLATVDFLAGVVPMYPPFSVVFTDWLSTIPAVGSGFFPSATRTARRSASLIRSQTPALTH